MRSFSAILLSTVLFASNVQAQPPLPAGKPAGPHQAALSTNEKVILVTAGLAISLGIIGVVMSR